MLFFLFYHFICSRYSLLIFPSSLNYVFKIYECKTWAVEKMNPLSCIDVLGNVFIRSKAIISGILRVSVFPAPSTAGDVNTNKKCEEKQKGYLKSHS